jgi:hypothetical protein
MARVGIRIPERVDAESHLAFGAHPVAVPGSVSWPVTQVPVGMRGLISARGRPRVFHTTLRTVKMSGLAPIAEGMR